MNSCAQGNVISTESFDYIRHLLRNDYGCVDHGDDYKDCNYDYSDGQNYVF